MKNTKMAKRIFICLISVIVIFSSAFVLLNAEQFNNAFNPNQYEDLIDKTNSSNEDASTFGTPGESDSTYDDKQQNSAANESNSLSQQDPTGMENDGNGGSTITTSGGVVGDASVGTDGSASAGKDPQTNEGAGGSGSGTQGGQGGQGGGTGDNGNTYQAVSDPNNLKPNTNREDTYTLNSLSIETIDAKIPEFYYGQQIELKDLLDYIKDAEVKMTNNVTKQVTILHGKDIVNSLQFAKPTNNAGSYTWTGESSFTITDGSDIKLIYKKPNSGAVGGSTEKPANVCAIKFKFYNYHIELIDPDDNGKIFSRGNTNDTTYDVSTAYDEYITKHENDSTFIDLDTKKLKQLFCGWRLSINEPYSISSIVLASSKGVQTAVSHIDSIPNEYGIYLENKQQTLKEYTGSSSTLVVPEGVSVLDFDQAVNNNVTEIQLSSSVTSVDFKSLYEAFPNLKSFTVSEQSTTYSAKDGILYNKNETKLINVPNNYWNGNTLNIPANVSIGEDAFYNNTPSNIKVLLEKDNPLDTKGIGNIPNNSTIYINNDDNDLPYLRLFSYFENKMNISIENDNTLNNEYVLDGKDVYIKDSNKLAYLAYDSEKKYSTYTLDSNVSEVIKTAFVDAGSKIYTLTIPSTVDKLDTGSLSYLTKLESLIVDDGTNTNIADNLFGENTLDSNFVLYVNNVSKDDANYNKWVSELDVIFGEDQGKDHIVVGDIYINNEDGAIYTKTSEGLVLEKMPTNVSEFKVPEGKKLVGINAFAFKDCTNIKKIILPAGVDIDKDAFSGCNSLEVLYSEGSINDDVRKVVKKLPAIKTVGDSTDTIKKNEYVFYSIDKTELLAVVSDYDESELKLESNTYKINDKALKDCKKVENLVINNTHELTIGDNAFENCINLNTLPSNSTNKIAYKEIGADAFKNCSSLTEIAITGKDLVIGDNAFAGLRGVKSISINGSVDSIGDAVFKDNTKVETVNFGDKDSDITTMGSAIFEGCTSLGQINIDAKIKSIGAHSFDGCTNLTSVNYTNRTMQSILSIDDYAFNDCAKYTWQPYLTQFSNLESVGERAYYNCTGLINSLQTPSSLRTIGKEAFALDADKKGNLKTFNPNSFENLLCEIGEGAFRNNSLQTLYLNNLNEGVVIKDHAFENCAKLDTIYWGSNTIISIGEYCFAGDIKILDGDLNQQSQLTSIGKYAFAGCSSINGVNLERATKLTTISEGLFGTYKVDDETLKCDQLTNVSLGTNVKTIESKAFTGAINLNSLNINNVDTVVSASADIFAKNDDGDNALPNLTVYVPSGEDNAMYNAYLKDWENILTSTNGSYFSDDIASTSLDKQTLLFRNGEYHINEDGSYTLVKMNESKENGAVLATGTKEIADGAFKDCTKLTSVLIPDTVEKIGSHVFENCGALEVVTFKGSNEIDIKDSLFNDSTPNSNFRIYIPTKSDSNYSKNEYLKDYSIISAGVNFTVDERNGAMYSLYESTEDYASNGYLYQLLYLPKSYAFDFHLLAQTSYIYDNACTNGNLTAFYVPASNNLVAIGNNVFRECKQLKTVDLASYWSSSRIDILGDAVFKDCTALSGWYSSGSQAASSKVSIDSISSMGKEVFAGCTSIGDAMWTSKNLSDIPEATFENCTSLAKMSFGASLTEMNLPIKSFGKRCFAGCTSFTTQAGSLASFGGLTTIGDECYDGCKNMSLMVLPESLKTMGVNALRGCDKLEVMCMSSSLPINLANSGMSEATWSSLGLYVPNGSKSAYIAEFAKQGLSSPGNIVDPSPKYRTISGNVYGCDDPTWTYYGGTKGGVKHSGLIFAGTTSANALKGKVAIYNSSTYCTTEIGADALKGNKNITYFVGSKTNGEDLLSTTFISKIGDSAFEGCSNMTGAYFSPTNTTYILEIGNRSFADCTSLKEFGLRVYTKSIGTYAFSNVKSDFVLDASTISAPSTCVLGDKIFGDTLPAGYKIKVNPTCKADFIKYWGKKLMNDYDLSDQQVSDLFILDQDNVSALSVNGASINYINDASTDSNKVETSIIEDTTTNEEVETKEEAANNDDKQNQEVLDNMQKKQDEDQETHSTEEEKSE